MSKEKTIQRVEADMAAGDLGKARDRLHGLLRAYPDDLQIRLKLAEIYSQLQYPHMAGCYWYLEEDQTDEMRRSVEIFTKRCGNDPWVIWRWIKFRGDPDKTSPCAKQRIYELIEGCKKKYGSYPDYRNKKTTYIETTKQKWSNSVFTVGCLMALILILVCAVIGFRTVMFWII